MIGTAAAGQHDNEPCANCGTHRLGAYCHACGQVGHVHRTIGALVHDIAHGVFHFEGKLWATLPLLARRPGELTRRYVQGERAKFVSPVALFLFSVFLMFAVVSSLASHTGAQEGATRVPVAANKIHSGVPGVDATIRRLARNPDLALYKMKSYAYKYSWALIPLSLPFLWLLFAFRRDVGLYDHAIFATYSLSFMSLGVVLLVVASRIGVPSAIIAFAAMLVPPWHMYRQLKGAYGLGRFGALWRTGALLIIAAITGTLFATFLFYLGTD